MPTFTLDVWHPHVEVRSVGPRLYEARTCQGYYSAVGFSREESVENLRAKLPSHSEPRVENIPLPLPEYYTTAR